MFQEKFKKELNSGLNNVANELINNIGYLCT